LAAADDRLAETAEHVAIGGPETHESPTLTGDFPVSPAGTAAAPLMSVADYRLLHPLGEGGMGAVWEAEQASSGRRVALKLLSQRLPRTPETIERFLREGQLAASVSHPRSTFVFGAGEHEGQPYIVMELMPGRTLKDLIDEEGSVSIARSVDFILDVIEGLQAAHAIGVVHRDVKPSNCFLDSDGRVKVGDFGLSKSLVSDAGLTRTGTFLGTPQYAAPEQVRGGQVDPRTDL
jgi:eukaryotic-like serine/threonine-protein kinase